MKTRKNNFKDLYERNDYILGLHSDEHNENKSENKPDRSEEEIEDIEDMSIIDHHYHNDLSEVLRYSGDNDIRD